MPYVHTPDDGATPTPIPVTVVEDEMPSISSTIEYGQPSRGDIAIDVPVGAAATVLLILLIVFLNKVNGFGWPWEWLGHYRR